MERTFIPEVCVGFFQIADLSVAITLETAWAEAQVANPELPDIDQYQYLLMLDAEVANVRYRADGTAPTASVGNRIIEDTQLIYTAATRTTLTFIAEEAGAKLNIGIYRHTV
jgi:hypothetical protein